MTASNKTILKVLLLGDSGVGKTSIMKRYVKNKFTNQYKASIGTDFLTKQITVDEVSVDLQIWDTAGQERFFSLSPYYCRGADCCILVYDTNNPRTFESLESWREKFFIQTSLQDPEKIPFAVIGNKIDMGEPLVSRKTVHEWCQARGNIPFFFASAKENHNVTEAFTSVVQNAPKEKTIYNYFGQNPIILEEDEDEEEEKKKGGICC